MTVSFLAYASSHIVDRINTASEDLVTRSFCDLSFLQLKIVHAKLPKRRLEVLATVNTIFLAFMSKTSFSLKK